MCSGVPDKALVLPCDVYPLVNKVIVQVLVSPSTTQVTGSRLKLIERIKIYGFKL